MKEDFQSLWFEDNALHLLDQRVLPEREDVFVCRTFEDTAFAIQDMVVRGAPAIGAAAGYGYYLAAYSLKDAGTQFSPLLEEASAVLDASRPTAVNLRWALHRMASCAKAHKGLPIPQLLETLLQEAHRIRQEDIETNMKLSRIGAEVIPQGAGVLTHCNTGALATAGWGTALGVIKEAHRQGKQIHVYADETRPRLQGARLTAWELMKAGIPSTLIADSTAAVLIREGKIDCVILGGDRVAANGDVCNKIGTFMLSVICRQYGVPFYSAVPVSTIDFDISSGDEIPIEERDASEVTSIAGNPIAPEGMAVFNPAFDVTPHQFVTGIITEQGILRPPYHESIKKLKRTGNSG